MEKSQIDDKLTEQERTILSVYRTPKVSDLRRQIRLSVQYAIGTGIFLGLAIVDDEPLWGIVVYAVFVLWMIVRLCGMRRVVGIMPRLIEKYETEIAELRSQIVEL